MVVTTMVLNRDASKDIEMHPNDAHQMRPINAYFCDAGEQRDLAEYVDGWPRYDTWRLCNLVFAETPGKAKVLLLSTSKYGTAEFTDVRARKVAGNVQRDRGIARPSDPLWDFTWGPE